ncbi:MAG: FAD-binding oxidoreductase [Promethearchaeota archaeon]|nr:MAG: FAD-binding oxidoreductase [Candidatus Lokiarchaeota archaeon]
MIIKRNLMTHMNIENFGLIYKEDRVAIKDKKAIKQRLIEILGEQNVSNEGVDIMAYTNDTTLITLNWILEGKIAGLPDFITWPDSIEQITQILKLANEEKIPVIPFAEGSGVVGGAIPNRGGIILDMKKFNKILEINDKDLTVTMEAGMNGMNLERHLNAKGYTTGHIPQSLYTSSVGGWIAHRAAGQFSTKYGKIEDILLGMEVILPQGDIINFKTMARASTGPQFEKLFLGGEGTLGIVTKATLKIWPYPEKRALISYAFPTFEDSLEATRQILRQQIYPAVIRIYDADETYRHFGHIEKATDKVMVVFVCEGIERLVALEAQITKETCEKNKGIACGEEPVEHWFETRFRVTETSSMPPYKIVADTIEVASMWEDAAKIYHSVIDAASQIKGMLLTTAHVSHFYPNGVGIYFTFGGVPEKNSTDFEFYKKAWNTIVKAVEDSGGSFGHHHGVGINRSQWMEREWGNAFKTIKEIKKLLDPNNILNPGKIYVKTWKQGGEN